MINRSLQTIGLISQEKSIKNISFIYSPIKHTSLDKIKENLREVLQYYQIHHLHFVWRFVY